MNVRVCSLCGLLRPCVPMTVALCWGCYMHTGKAVRDAASDLALYWLEPRAA